MVAPASAVRPGYHRALPLEPLSNDGSRRRSITTHQSHNKSSRNPKRANNIV